MDAIKNTSRFHEKIRRESHVLDAIIWKKLCLVVYA